MRTRMFVVAMLAVFSLPAAWGPGGPPPTAAAPRRAKRPPNVLIVLTDDQRAGEDSMKVMPETMSRIGRKGLMFSNAYAVNPICCPSRATIMTGQYAHNHGVVDNYSAGELDTTHTLQAALDDAGYDTSIFGKYLNLWYDHPPHFDRWMTFKRADPRDYRNVEYNDQGEIREIDRYTTDVLRSAAVEHLEANERNDKRPWFMLVTPNAPHAPYKPAARHRSARVPKWSGNPALAETDRTDKPDFVQDRSTTPGQDQGMRRGQLRAQMAIDEMVAKLDRVLERLDERGNTLVIFMSDNGYLWGEHGLLGTVYSKNTPYNASIRIPMMMRWPGHLERKESPRLVTNADVAPTIYDATGIAPPARLDGRSLLDGRWQRRLLFFEHSANTNEGAIPAWISIRTRDKQYVEYFDDQGEISFREYYDLDADPWQLENLLGDQDPLNDPDTYDEHALVTRLSTCRGTSGWNPCP